MTKQEISTKLKSINDEVQNIMENLEGDEQYIDQMFRHLMNIQDKIGEAINYNETN